jgi:acetyltransferase
MTERRFVLLFERADLIGPPLRSILSQHGMDVQTCRDADVVDARVLDRASQASCILVQDRMGSSDTISLIEAVRERGCGTPIIVAVHAADADTVAAYRSAGATDVVGIPLIYAYLMNRLGDLDKVEATREPHRLALRDGTEVAFRFLHPEDRDLEQDFVRALSDRSRYLRFFTPLRELSENFLEVFTHNEFPRSYAVIATVDRDGAEVQIGVARYMPTETAGTAEFAVAVADGWQRRGLASSLMHIVIVAAALAGYRHLDGIILRENAAMLGLAKKLGFGIVKGQGDGPLAIRVRKTLAA